MDSGTSARVSGIGGETLLGGVSYRTMHLGPEVPLAPSILATWSVSIVEVVVLVGVDEVVLQAALTTAAMAGEARFAGKRE